MNKYFIRSEIPRPRIRGELCFFIVLVIILLIKPRMQVVFCEDFVGSVKLSSMSQHIETSANFALLLIKLLVFFSFFF